MQRARLFGFATVVLSAGMLFTPSSARTAEVTQTVKIEARRFVFTPNEITVKKGVPVEIEVTTRDVEHGFTIPDFKVRTEVEPGTVSRVWFTPDKAGTFTFLCDIYCGSGHEDMSGTLVVTDE